MADCSVRFARSESYCNCIFWFSVRRRATVVRSARILSQKRSWICFMSARQYAFSSSLFLLLYHFLFLIVAFLSICVCVYFLMNLTVDLCWLMAPNCGCIFITNVANWFIHSTGLHNLLPIRAFHLAIKWEEEELLLGFSFELKIAIEQINQLGNR